MTADYIPKQNFVFEKGVYAAIMSNAVIIDEQCFAHTNVEYVDSPKCRQVCAGAFESCTKLVTFRFTSKCLIGKNAFRGCARLVNINMHLICSLNAFSFAGTSLVSVDLQSITQDFVPAHAFSDCYNLTFFKAKCTKIERRAFYRCEKLTRVECGRIEYVKEQAFFQCTSLNYVADLTQETQISVSSFAKSELISRVLEAKKIYPTKRVRKIKH